MKIAEDVHLVEGSAASNIYLVTGDRPILIDTGMPRTERAVLRYLESIRMAPSSLAAIVLTHHDIDHIGSAAALHDATSAPIWAPHGDLPYIRGELRRHGLKRYLPTLLRPFVGALRSFEVDRELREGDRLPGGFTVIETPGHTPGHISLYRPGLLIAGDLVSTRPDGPRGKKASVTPSARAMSSDLNQVAESMRRAAGLECACIAAGHGRPILSGGEEAVRRSMMGL